MTLYATDLDGTLLDNNARLSEYTARMFRELVDQGVLITFVTARTPATVEPILADAHPKLPGVAMTGSTIWNPLRRQYDYVQYLHRDHVAVIRDVCLRKGVHPFVYTLPVGSNTLVVYQAAHDMSQLEEKFVHERTINDLKTFRLGQSAPEETADCTVLFFAMGNPDTIKSAADEIRYLTGCYASCYPDTYHPGLALLEVFAPGVSKANGLARLKQMLGADRVVAFGDNLNDIPLLAAADMAIAVDNAHSDVKAVAHKIIAPNNADSVIKFIMEAERNRSI